MKILLDPEASLEIRQAAEFYEDCHKGLGQEFLDAVESAFEQIQRHPRVWRILKGRFRRYLLQQFPYGLIYAVEEQTIFVAAVMHLSENQAIGFHAARLRSLSPDPCTFGDLPRRAHLTTLRSHASLHLRITQPSMRVRSHGSRSSPCHVV